MCLCVRAGGQTVGVSEYYIEYIKRREKEKCHVCAPASYSNILLYFVCVLKLARSLAFHKLAYFVVVLYEKLLEAARCDAVSPRFFFEVNLFNFFLWNTKRLLPLFFC